MTINYLDLWGEQPSDYGVADSPGFFPLAGMGGGMMWLDRLRRGEYVPAFLNSTQLGISRKRIRQLCVNNEIASNIVAAHVAYAVGDGFQYEVTPKDPAHKKIAENAQGIVDAFIEHNELALREAETLSRMLVDGEAFVRTFPRDTGILALRFVEPECVRSPDGDGIGQNTFGVRTPVRDVETVEGYWVVETPSGGGDTPVFVPASEIAHFKHPETPSCSKRGLSAFYPVEGTLRGAEDLLHATVSMAKARAKVAWFRKLNGAGSDVASALLANTITDSATDPVTGDTVNMERIRNGTIMTLPGSVDIEFPAANIGASDHCAVYQMVLRTIASRFQMPEYLLTSDASNGSYSSTLVAESPFVKSMKRYQDVMARLLGKNRWYGPRQSLVWRQLAYAVEVGLLPEGSLRLIDVQVTGQSLTSRDMDKEARVDQIYNGMGIKSKTTIQQEQGLDPDIEKQNFAKERAEGNVTNPQDMPGVPGMTPQEQQQGAAVAGGFQEPTPARESFDEDKHPRADNGQFGSGGGGSSSEDSGDVEIHDPKTGEVFWKGSREEGKQLLADQSRDEPGHGLELRPAKRHPRLTPPTKADGKKEGSSENLPSPSDYKAFKSGKPVKDVTVYRGEAKGGHGSGLSALGEGKYYAVNPKVALRFSKEGTVKDSKVSLENPAVIHNDDEMRELKQRAERDTGLDFGKKTNMYEGMLLGDQAKQFTQYLKSQGHDGLITTYPEAPGGEQLLVFNPDGKKPQPVEEAYSGRKIDKLGRTRCYSDGKPTKCVSGDGISQDKSHLVASTRVERLLSSPASASPGDLSKTVLSLGRLTKGEMKSLAAKHGLKRLGGDKQALAGKIAAEAAKVVAGRSEAAREARKVGVDPREMASTAREMRASAGEFNRQAAQVVKDASAAWKQREGKPLTRAHPAFRGGDPATLGGEWEEIAQALAREHPGMLGSPDDSTENARNLYDLFLAGAPKLPPMRDSYSEAIAYLHGRGAKGKKAHDDGEEIPF